METEKWRDGTDMICSICGEPIWNDQPRYATISHSPKKREAKHYFCAGGTMTIIGSPEPGVMEATQYGGKFPDEVEIGNGECLSKVNLSDEFQKAIGLQAPLYVKKKKG